MKNSIEDLGTLFRNKFSQGKYSSCFKYKNELKLILEAIILQNLLIFKQLSNQIDIKAAIALKK